MNNTNGWDSYKKLVVHELERSNSRLTEIDSRLRHIEKKLAILDTKVYAATFLFSIIFTAVFNMLAGWI